jgi:hypothetical protein
MATGFTDFSEYSDAANLLADDWSVAFGSTGPAVTANTDADTPGGMRMTYDATSASTHTAARWDSLPDAEDWEVLILIKKFEDDDHLTTAAARLTSSAFIGGLRNNPTDVTFRSVSASGSTTVANAAHSSLTVTNYNWVRFQVRGTACKVKAWAADLNAADFGMGDEPGSWLIEETSSLVTGSGKAGVHFGQTTTPGRVMHIGWFGYGTGTDDAPGPAAGVNVDLGLAEETSTAFAVDVAQDLSADLGLAEETSAAFAVDAEVEGEQVVDLGLAEETSTAFALDVGQDQTAPLGLAEETSTAFAVSADLGSDQTATLGLAEETSTAFAVDVAQDRSATLGLAEETSTAFGLSLTRELDLGLAEETSAAFTLSLEAARFVNLGLAEEKNVAWRLDSGLPPFRWEFYAITTPGKRPSRRSLRPLVFTDRVTGTTYTIQLSEGMLMTLEEIQPWLPSDEVYQPFHEPTLSVDGRIVRLYVEEGELKFEFYTHHVRNRPILFGRVPRPKAWQPKYVLVLDGGAIDEA